MTIGHGFCDKRIIAKLVLCHPLELRNIHLSSPTPFLMPGVTYTSDVDMQTLLSLWAKSIPDYGDAVLAAYCKKTKGTHIATFDKKFNNALTRVGLTVTML